MLQAPTAQCTGLVVKRYKYISSFVPVWFAEWPEYPQHSAQVSRYDITNTFPPFLHLTSPWKKHCFWSRHKGIQSRINIWWKLRQIAGLALMCAVCCHRKCPKLYKLIKMNHKLCLPWFGLQFNLYLPFNLPASSSALFFFLPDASLFAKATLRINLVFYVTFCILQRFYRNLGEAVMDDLYDRFFEEGGGEYKYVR